MTEPRALHIIGAVCFLRFKRAANEIGKLAHGAQVELQGFAVPFQLLLQAVEKRLNPFIVAGTAVSAAFLIALLKS